MTIKKTVIFFLFVCAFLGVKAQYQLIEIGPAFNLPAGNSTNISSGGVEAYLKGEIGLSTKFALTANIGMASFFGKKIYGPRTQTLNYMPVKAGLKYYTDDNFYVEGQLGRSFGLNGTKKGSFILSPGIGTFFKQKNNNNKLDIGLRYESWINSSIFIPSGTRTTTFSFFSLRAGYAFNL